MTKVEKIPCVRLIKRNLNEEYFQPVIGVDVLLTVGVSSKLETSSIEFYRNNKLENLASLIKLQSSIDSLYHFVLYVKIKARDFYKITADDSCILTSWLEQEIEEE